MTHMPIQVTSPAGMPQASAPPDPRLLLDETLARLRAGEPVEAAIAVLAEGLQWLRGLAAPAAWQRSVAAVRKHPLLAVLHQNPLARRCFQKPRGYAGDAPMLDMLYLGEPALVPSLLHQATPPLGLALFRRDHASAAGVAARARIGLMAARIDAAAEARRNPHVLALGCGHLREAGLSRAVREGRIGRFVALDQDAASLAVVQVEQAAQGIETLHRSPKATFDGTLPRGGFDLIYAVALYDDLTDRLAHTVTAASFALLRPGGRLLVANLDRDCGEGGYFEACHDWVRCQRDAAGMLRLAHGIPPEDTALCHLLPGEGAGEGTEQHVLEIVRRGGAG